MDFEALRTELHRAVDEIIDRHIGRAPGHTGKEPAEVVKAIGDAKKTWSYRWPGGGEEKFHRAQWYAVTGDRGSHRVVVAWAHRGAWGKEDRLRAIVFLHQGQPDSTTYYPLTEFVETDDDRFAATIPRPGHPRAQLRADDQRPERLRGAAVERADALFESIAKSSSVRLVLDEGDEEAMVRHGYWVATLRNRF
ncbi:hypothetical protein [Kitasatospora sp. NPDC093102]|uniref:hypothetical protein n=1 Tax=Kitasatospora sp. NPDC093102 TaxID=3155069 RepID=UPI003443EA60